MTDADKQFEIAERITRLNEIRSELAVSKSKWRNGCKELMEAGIYYAERSGQGQSQFSAQRRMMQVKEPEAWPDPDELKSYSEQMRSLKEGADFIIKELKDIGGIDADLFKINGD